MTETIQHTTETAPIYITDPRTNAALDRMARQIAEAKARNLSYFVTALRDNGGTLEERGVTTRPSNCPVCYREQAKGVRRFWFSVPRLYNGTPCGNESFHFHPCPECLAKIHEAIAIPVEMPQTVTA